MYASFYTAASGAEAQQARMDVTANNLANSNTSGFKPENAVFSQLMYYNLHQAQEQRTKLQAGTGTEIGSTVTDFSQASLTVSDGAWDYAIEGNGFFRLVDPETGEVSYTRNGHFSLSGENGVFYLTADSGKRVTDVAGQPVTLNGQELSADPGIFTFDYQSGLIHMGENEYRPGENSGRELPAQGAVLKKGYLEASGTDMITEMTKIIENQRVYSYSLKMLQTSDEVMETINTLR